MAVSVRLCRAGLAIVLAGAVVTVAAAPATAGTTTTSLAKPRTVPVVACPTAYGLDDPGGKRPPRTATTPPIPVDTPAVSYYQTRDGELSALAPAGWTCDGVVAVDGGLSLEVKAKGAKGKHPDSVFVMDIPACLGCMAETVCAVIPSAMSALHFDETCYAHKPRGETVRHIRGTHLWQVRDPAGVSGTVDFSGGRHPGQELIRYEPAIPHVATASCVLPASQDRLCQTVLAVTMGLGA